VYDYESSFKKLSQLEQCSHPNCIITHSNTLFINIKTQTRIQQSPSSADPLVCTDCFTMLMSPWWGNTPWTRRADRVIWPS